jgi:hypothetical protein
LYVSEIRYLCNGKIRFGFYNQLIINILNKKEMENLVKQIESAFGAFFGDANSQIVKGNKAAGIPARKVSLELEKMLKEFRKLSLEAAKK